MKEHNSFQMNKVLFIATEFAPGMIPFASTIINILANDKRFDIRAICVNSGRKSYYPYIEEKDKVSFIEYPQSKFLKIVYKIWPIKIIKQIRKLVLSFNPDVIHFLTGDFSLVNYIKITNVKNMCYTVHDLHPHEIQHAGLFPAIFKKYIDSNCMLMAKMIPNITTSSKSQVFELEMLYPNKIVFFTPFPTLITKEIMTGTAHIPELEGISDYILFFGAVHKYKGIELLINAYNNIDKENIPKLVIAGCGGVCETGNPNIIRINRFIDDNEIKSLFENAKLVVYPYLSATMSGVLSIAFFFKKEVLLSDVPFFVDNKETCCKYFKAGNIHDLQDKLKESLSSPTKVTTDCYSSIYSNKALADAYFSFYRKIKQDE